MFMKLKIIKFDHFGRGISKDNEKIIFVDKALPEEIVDVIITKENKKYSEARIINIEKKNQKRKEVICPYYEKCGGCNLLHMSYDLEKEFKKDKAMELLHQCDNFYETKKLNYRNKCTLHVKDNKIGYYKEKTNEIVTIDYCYLLDERINKVISDLKSISMGDYAINKIIIKSHNNQLLMEVDGIVDDFFIDYFNDVDTIISNKKIVKGKGYLEEVISNKTFKITSEAFFQVNKEGLENINRIIHHFIANKKIINALDLYSGTSLWGILISDLAEKITCVEVNIEATDNAKWNIKRNNISNIKVINGKVEDYIDSFKDIDLVIIDPPRSGLDKKTINYLKRINSKYLIYVSCDMQTLKRDLNDLEDSYNLLEVNLVDMFKMTYHCEVVTILERKNK